VGTVVGLSRRESSIERTSYEGRRTTGDRVDNALAKVSYWGEGGAVSDLTLKFSNRREENQNAVYRDTVWTDDHGAFGFTYAYEQAFKAGKFTGQVGWDRFGDRRRSDATSLVTYRIVNPASTVTEGGFGKEATTSDTQALKARFDFNPMRSGAVEHRIYAGLQADRVDAGYERMTDAYSYQLYRATPTATPSYRSMVLYRQGQVDVAYQDLALYLADTLVSGRVTLQAGLRADRDTYLGNTNLSPRFAVEWDLSGARTTLLKAGVARYYGEGILDLAFARAKSGLKQQLTSSTGAVVTTPTVPTLSLYGDLRSPHDDELALSATRFWAGLQGTLSYVRRLGRDQISPRTIAGGTQYVNDGRSTTDTAAFTLRNRKPGSFAGAEWTGNLEVDYTRSRRNYDLVTSYQETVEEGKLYYNGTLIDAVSRPASDFNQPMRASGELHGQWSLAGLGWTNRLSWKGRRQAAFYKGVNASDGYEIYEDTNIASYWTLDTILSWQPFFHRHLEFRVEVTNVLNRMPVLVPTSPTISTSRDVFVTGREIWFEANYRF
ncbi:MAG: TonB-dependent receptor, partial [Holophaga sp.]|nr:TonB-dependent receptor [Holophaga sp.]